ncbi:MAG: hypothetical protein R2873_24805 [Caldilineaceae bacterium]
MLQRHDTVNAPMRETVADQRRRRFGGVAVVVIGRVKDVAEFPRHPLRGFFLREVEMTDQFACFGEDDSPEVAPGARQR